MQQFSLVPENQVKRLKRLRPRLQLCFFIKHSAKFYLGQRSKGRRTFSEQIIFLHNLFLHNLTIYVNLKRGNLHIFMIC